VVRTSYCLLMGLVLLGLLAGCVPIWMVPKDQRPTIITPAPAPAPAAEPTATTPPTEATVPQQPGEMAALQTTKAFKPGWQAMVNSHTGDWSEVVVLTGPAWQQWSSRLRLRWTETDYQVTRDEPLAATAASQPGEQAALATAKARRSDWAATVNSHTNDWLEVVVKMGPSWGDWRTGLRLRWTGSGYQVVTEGPIPQPSAQPRPKPKPKPAATSSGKTTSAARRIVQGRHPGWVTKVVDVEGNNDVVVVWTGPPRSEFAFWYRIAWSGGRYVIQDEGAIQGPDSM